eukprot:gene35115-39717_t
MRRVHTKEAEHAIVLDIHCPKACFKATLATAPPCAPALYDLFWPQPASSLPSPKTMFNIYKLQLALKNTWVRIILLSAIALAIGLAAWRSNVAQDTSPVVRSQNIAEITALASQRERLDYLLRRAALTGWVYAPFRLGDVMTGLGGERAAKLDVEIYDGEALNAASRMYDSRPGPPQPGMRHTMQKISLAGHR